MFMSPTIPKKRLLPGVHGLRGIAALSIVAFHLIHLSGIQAPLGWGFIGEYFGLSVHLFFIISAFSLLYSHEASDQTPDWVAQYYIKRFFRIAPLFYLLLLYYILIFYTYHVPRQVDIPEIITNFTFTMNFTGRPESLVWAGWTIGVEMIFYVIMPILIILMRGQKSVILFSLIAILLSYASHYVITNSTNAQNAYFSFISNLYVFVLGIAAYWLYTKLIRSAESWKVFSFIAAITGLVLLFSGAADHMKLVGRPDIIIWAIVFSILCASQAARPSWLFANQFLEYAGERSFSIYLLHPLVIVYLKPLYLSAYSYMIPTIGDYAYFICLVIVLSILIPLAELTYRFIEVPGIRFGSKLNKRRRTEIGQQDTVNSVSSVSESATVRSLSR